MSYDLYFRARASAPTREQILAYFEERPLYEARDDAISYANDDTDVDFNFYLSERAGEDGLLPISFNLNFGRPHVFALEAEPELRAFVDAFDLAVRDPQKHGTGDAPYSREGFLAGYDHGNALACQILREVGGQSKATLDAEVLEAVWRWNYARRALQEHANWTLMLTSFVPVIFLVRAPNDPARVKTSVVWNAEPPTLLPCVDYCAVPADGGVKHVRYAAVAQLLGEYALRTPPFRFREGGREHELTLPFHEVDYPIDGKRQNAPAWLGPALAALEPEDLGGRVRRVPLDQVLSAV